MSTINDALFGQDDSTEENDEINTNDTDDGLELTEEIETTDEETDVEEEVEETEESSEETETETETSEDDEVKLSPAEERIARAAEGRLNALRDEREKRQHAERERDEMRQRMDQYERQQAQLRAANMPDPDSDPYGYARAVQEQAEQQVLETKFAFSDRMARATHGAEKVEEAANWAMTHLRDNPNLNAVMRQHDDPLGWIVQQYDREMKMTKFVEDPDALFKKWAEDNGYKPANQIATPQTPVVAAPKAPAATAKAPKRAAAATVAAPGRRNGEADASTSMTGILGLK